MKIKDEVLAIISRMEQEGNLLKIADGQLDRKLYLEVNKVLEAMGGKWNRKIKGHVFNHDITDQLDSVLLTGEIIIPKEIGFFPTPPDLASRLVEQSDVHPEHRILEPSAGLGRLYLAGIDAAPLASWVLVEQSPDCCRELYGMAQTAQIKQGDFLERDDLGKFGAVIMNPPFKQGRDIKHIKRALGTLEPGGTLISLCYNGARQNKQLRPLADTWEVLPEGSFKDQGTAASVVLLTMIKK